MLRCSPMQGLRRLSGYGFRRGVTSSDMSELRVHDAMWILDPMARRVRRRLSVLEHDELVSVGYIALRKASETFDPTLGVAFSSYAWMRVFGAMLDVARKHVNVASRVHGACLQAITLLGPRLPVQLTVASRCRSACRSRSSSGF